MHVRQGLKTTSVHLCRFELSLTINYMAAFLRKIIVENRAQSFPGCVGVCVPQMPHNVDKAIFGAEPA